MAEFPADGYASHSGGGSGAAVGKPVVLIGAGGTGGHMYPAEAMARELIKNGYEVLLLTDARGQRYTEDFPSEVQIYNMPAADFRGGPIRRFFRLFGLVSGFFKAKEICDNNLPAFAIGFGGGVSFYVAAAAVVSRVPLYLHEQNAVIGRVNRRFAGWARLVGLGLPVTRDLPEGVRAEHVGTPVRQSIRLARNSTYPLLDLRSRVRVLVLGGSQGASVMGYVVPQALKFLPEEYRRRLHIIQQVRHEEADMVRETYMKVGVMFEIRNFIRNVGEEMAQAHLVISRSGASTVAELTVVGRPAVLVPYPHSADNQQLYNAKIMTDREAGWLFNEEHFTARNLAVHLRALIEVPMRMHNAAQMARSLGVPDAAAAFLRRIEGDLPLGRKANRRS